MKLAGASSADNKRRDGDATTDIANDNDASRADVSCVESARVEGVRSLSAIGVAMTNRATKSASTADAVRRRWSRTKTMLPIVPTHPVGQP